MNKVSRLRTDQKWRARLIRNEFLVTLVMNLWINNQIFYSVMEKSSEYLRTVVAGLIIKLNSTILPEYNIRDLTENR